MAMLDIHEVRADVPGDLRRPGVILDKPLQLAVGPDLRIARHLEGPVEDRMPIGDARFEAELVIRFAETAGVRQLEADDQIVGGAAAFLVRRHQRLAEPGQVSLVLLVDDELVRIGPAIGPHGHGFPAKDQLGAALTKSLPATHHLLGDPAAGRAVPALHGVDGVAVADVLAVDGDVPQRLGEGRSRPGGDGVLARQVDSQRGHVGAELGDGF